VKTLRSQKRKSNRATYFAAYRQYLAAYENTITTISQIPRDPTNDPWHNVSIPLPHPP
jgi:hypothetical protein